MTPSLGSDGAFGMGSNILAISARWNAFNVPRKDWSLWVFSIRIVAHSKQTNMLRMQYEKMACVFCSLLLTTKEVVTLGVQYPDSDEQTCENPSVNQR